MRTVKFASFLIGSLIGAANFVPASAATKLSSQILGYQDPETGVFHPLKTIVPDATTTPTMVSRSSSGAFAAANTIPASGTSSTYTVNATL